MPEKDLGYRRIQCTGRGAYIISLPKTWVEDLDLERGSEIAFNIQPDNTLLLIPRKIAEKQAQTNTTKPKEYSINIDQKQDTQTTLRMIRALYTIGADVIRIRFKTEEDTHKYKTETKNFVRDTFLGAEIIDETPNEITLQIFIKHTEFSIEKAVRRMAIVALSANRNAITTLTNPNPAISESVIQTRNDVKRLGLYIVRQLKHGIEHNLYRELDLQTPKEFLLYRIAVINIENIAENALNISNNINTLQNLDIKTPLTKDNDKEVYEALTNYHTQAQQLYEDTTKAMFKRDYKDSEELISKREASAALEKKLMILISSKKMDHNVATILRLIFDNTKRIMDYTKNLAELTLNRTIEEHCTTLTYNKP